MKSGLNDRSRFFGGSEIVVTGWQIMRSGDVDRSRLKVVGVAVGGVAPALLIKGRPRKMSREFPPVIRVFSDGKMPGFGTGTGNGEGSS